ncbi:AAA family ATPase [Rhizobium sp. IMFF44]|uniref:AAA family ATPase n=1 Tax=Rhizobium sp. IMFF44 TaxID=3342350 RepID=UPI0035B81528
MPAIPKRIPARRAVARNDEPQPKQEVESRQPEPQKDDGPQLWEVEDFDPARELEIIDEIIEGVLPEVGICGLAGQSQAGKTVVALDLCKSLILGKSWLGKYNVPRPVGVVYLAYESKENVKRRWKAIYKDSKGATANAKVPFKIMKRPAVLSDMNAWEGLVMTLAALNDRFLEDHGTPLKLVVIDTVAASGMVKKENEADSWSHVIANLNDICEELNVVVLLLHHAAKSQESENIWRGSSSSYAAMEAVLGIKVDKQDGEVTRRWIYADKSKDGDTGYIADLTFEPVKVGVKRTGADMTAPVLRANTEGESKVAKKSKAETKIKALHESEIAFLKAVKAAMQEAGEERPTQLSTGRWSYSVNMTMVETEARRFIPTKNFKRDFESGRNRLLTRSWLELDDVKMRYNVTVEEPI